VTPFGLFDLIVFGALALLGLSVMVFTRIRKAPPPNSPAALLAQRRAAPSAHPGAVPSGLSPEGPSRGRRPLAVIAGDSITRGAVSANYVDMLASRLPDWDLANAGVNAELAYNLASRLDEIVALDPDAVTVLIGSNDVNATFGLRAALGYIAAHSLPEAPSPFFFRENLVATVRVLKRETRARVALFSIPPIGEEPGHYAYLRTEEYAQIVKAVAKEEGVEYLPLRERMCAYLESLPRRHPGALPFRKFGGAQLRANRQMNYLGKSLDEISASNGFALLVDGIHLNTHAASMAADLAESFLRSVTAGRTAAQPSL